MKKSITVVGIAGLGRMGSGMARSLLTAGMNVIGWDPEPACRDALDAAGGEAVDKLSELRRADVIILSLPSGRALQEVARTLAKSAELTVPIVIDTSTLPSADKMVARDTLGEVGIVLLDAPVIGGAFQAAQGVLTVLASGPREVIDSVRPVLERIGTEQYYVGEFGEGIKFKLVINHLVGVSNVLIAENMQIAQGFGMDTRLLHEIVSKSSLGSGLWKARASMMLDRAWADPPRQSGQLSIPLKDNSLIVEALKKRGLTAPLLEAALPIYDVARSSGLEQQDPSALLKVLEGLNERARDQLAEGFKG